MKKFLLINVVLTACAVCVLRSEEPVDVSTLLMRAINDDWEANYQLGLCRINGNGIEKNLTEGFGYFVKAAANGHAKAHFQLYNCYFNGIGTVIRKKTAIKHLRIAANGNVPEAQYYLGLHLKNGNRVKRNLTQAVQYFQKAAEQGYESAQIEYALCLLRGLGVAENDSEGMKYLNSAVEQGSAAAIYALGNCYKYGYAGKVNFKKAYELFTKAAEAGYAPANVALGEAFLHGQSVPKHPELAIEYFSRAAAENNTEGLLHLAECYFGGIGVSKNFQKSFTYYKKAAANKSPEAYLNLGRHYFRGMGTGKNLLLAFLNYSAAFRAGEVKAADELIRLLKTEHINDKYAPVLLPVLKHLAAQNKAPAQKFLGDCFLNGYGTRKDKKQAFYYYELSAGQKFPDAILQLASFYMTGEVVGKDLQKAIKLLLPLAGKNHAAAQYKLGLCYKDNGNWNDSKKWLAKAAQSGMKDAQKPLAFVEGKIQEEIDRENQIRWAMERQKYQEQYASSSGNRCADCGGSGVITNRLGRFRCGGCNGTGSPGYGTDYFDSNGRRQRSAMDQAMGRMFGTGGGIGGIFGN